MYEIRFSMDTFALVEPDDDFGGKAETRNNLL
jgi:hypothetical protein